MFLILTAEELIDILKGYNHTELHLHHTWKPNHNNFKTSTYDRV